MADLLEDIVKALRNLGGAATVKEIYTEVQRIQHSPTSKAWPKQVQQTIEINSSDFMVFRGIDVFHRIAAGTWELRDKQGVLKRLPSIDQATSKIPYPNSNSESQESILNYLRTIKEYRDYSDPTSLSWLQYIQEIFHILGFSTEYIDTGLLLLKDLGSNTRSIALVRVLLPDETNIEIAPGKTWEKVLLDAANIRQIKWGILTNGFMFQVFNYPNPEEQPPMVLSDLDAIINDQRVEDFNKLYEIISLIKGKPFQRDRIVTPGSWGKRINSPSTQIQPNTRHTPHYDRKAYTPGKEYIIPLLQALVNLGGSGRKVDVRDEVGNLMASVFTEADKQPLPFNPRLPAWYEMLNQERNKLIDSGLMASDLPTSIWGITDAGRQELLEGKHLGKSMKMAEPITTNINSQALPKINPRKTQGVFNLVREVFDTIQPPYSEDIIEDVFLAIENHPNWRKIYDDLVLELSTIVVNNRIGFYTRQTTGLEMTSTVKAKRSHIIGQYMKLR